MLFKIAAKGEKTWSQMSLARELGMSSGSVNVALERSRIARLYSPDRRRVRYHALGEAVNAGGRYFFAVELGPRARGMPTASGGPALRGILPEISGQTPVWPSSDGDGRGPSIEPLHPSVPAASRDDPALYRLLTLFDSVRIGDARERGLALVELQSLLRPEAATVGAR